MANPIQVRQTPLILSANREGMTGSWFSTGYYGHSRAKARMDLCDFYRQLARPVPPRKFLDRQQNEATMHQFSQHDNRFKLENDPIIRATESGFGRRRSSINRRGDFDPTFLSWMSKTKIAIDSNEFDKNSSETIFTSVARSLPLIESSTYVRDYHHGQPTSEQSKQIRQETFQRYSSSQTRRLRLQREEQSPSVASCLVWNHHQIEKRPSTTTLEETVNETVVPLVVSSSSSTNRDRRPSFQSQSMINLPVIVSSEPMRSKNITELVSKYL